MDESKVLFALSAPNHDGTDFSRSSIVTSRSDAKELWSNGSFGSSTRSTRYMPKYLSQNQQRPAVISKGKRKRQSAVEEGDDQSEEVVAHEESLQLSLMETYWLSKHGRNVSVLNSKDESILDLLDHFNCRYPIKQSRIGFGERYAAYERFRCAGWVPKSGAQYGADLVLYEANPNSCHSRFSVLQEDSQRLPSIRGILGHIRVAEQTRKRLVMCNGQGESVQLKRWVLKHEQVITPDTHVGKTKVSLKLDD